MRYRASESGRSVFYGNLDGILEGWAGARRVLSLVFCFFFFLFLGISSGFGSQWPACMMGYLLGGHWFPVLWVRCFSLFHSILSPERLVFIHRLDGNFTSRRTLSWLCFGIDTAGSAASWVLIGKAGSAGLFASGLQHANSILRLRGRPNLIAHFLSRAWNLAFMAHC